MKCSKFFCQKLNENKCCNQCTKPNCEERCLNRVDKCKIGTEKGLGRYGLNLIGKKE